MPLVHAAVIPHNPLLIGSISKNHFPLLKETVDSIKNISNDCYAAKTKLAIFLSPHGLAIKDQIVIDSADSYHGDLVEFGDLNTKIKFPGAVGPIHQLKTVAERWQLPVSLQTTDHLDYGSTVPLTFFDKITQTLSIMPIFVGHLSFPQLVRLGGVLHDYISTSNTRIALYASSEWSRRHRASADERRRPTTEEKMASQAITQVDPARLSSTEPRPGTCGWPPLICLLTVLQNLSMTGRILSFQAPLGVGLITADFISNHDHRARHTVPPVTA
jgi:aromatic ring-opening dioxygenase LigB subunit